MPSFTENSAFHLQAIVKQRDQNLVNLDMVENLFVKCQLFGKIGAICV